jgi:dynein heavy chain
MNDLERYLPIICPFQRHFSVFNCTLPTDESMDRVFGTIGMGHYNAKRGFPEDIRELVQKLVALTRLLWKSTRRGIKSTRIL